MIDLFWKSHKKGLKGLKGLHVYLEKKKSNSDIFRQSVSFIIHLEQKCRNTCAHILLDFARIFRDFDRIFDISKPLEVGLYPTTSPPAPLPELASRSSIEIPSLLFIILNAGTQQTRLQSACSIGVARGAHGAYPTTFLAYIVILCFGRRYPKQNSVIRLKSNILAPATFWAGCAATM